uniref:Uncharacterized protein n=1 Tax=Schlesneria paludicola TaxID=360056 RepID=A0A7C2P1P9_9PLAN
MSVPPAWLQDFADAVAGHLHAVDVLSPLGCHFHQSDDLWEITVFASSTELVGGSRDGQGRVSRFQVDLLGLSQLFDDIQDFHWQAQGLGPQDDLGPHVSIVGRCRGQSVWLRVPAMAPKAFPPGRLAHVHQQSWEEVW